MSKNSNNNSQGKAILPPVRVAVLIDGGFFVKRFNHVYNQSRTMTGEEVAKRLYTIAHSHVGKENILYRIFYYDCHPFDKKMHNPINKQVIDFKSTQATALNLGTARTPTERQE